MDRYLSLQSELLSSSAHLLLKGDYTVQIEELKDNKILPQLLSSFFLFCLQKHRGTSGHLFYFLARLASCMTLQSVLGEQTCTFLENYPPSSCSQVLNWRSETRCLIFCLRSALKGLNFLKGGCDRSSVALHYNCPLLQLLGFQPEPLLLQ